MTWRSFWTWLKGLFVLPPQDWRGIPVWTDSDPYLSGFAFKVNSWKARSGFRPADSNGKDVASEVKALQERARWWFTNVRYLAEAPTADSWQTRADTIRLGTGDCEEFGTGIWQDMVNAGYLRCLMCEGMLDGKPHVTVRIQQLVVMPDGAVVDLNSQRRFTLRWSMDIYSRCWRHI